MLIRGNRRDMSVYGVFWLFCTSNWQQMRTRITQCAQNERDVTGSLSHRGNCLDNAVAERFFRRLKIERTNNLRYKNRSQDIADIIDSFYNLKWHQLLVGNSISRMNMNDD